MADSFPQSELEAARQIIRKGFAVYIPERTRSMLEGADHRLAPRSKTPLPPFAFAQKRIVSMVKENPHRNWLVFAYTDGNVDGALNALCKQLRPLAATLPGSRQANGRWLCLLALMDVKRRLNQDRKMWSIRQVCEAISLSESNWTRDYSQYWLGLREYIKKMDDEALSHFLKQVDLQQARKLGFL